MTKHVVTGQELYLFTLDSNNEAATAKVYVVAHNHSSIYFGYSKCDRKNPHMKIKATGSFPELWTPSAIEIHYLSDGPDFGRQWSNDVKRRSYYKSEIDSLINNLGAQSNAEKLEKVYNFLERIV